MKRLLKGVKVAAITWFIFSGLSSCVRAAPSIATSVPDIIETGEVRPLPGQLDSVPMFNSDSPEWVKKSGILLSTFPPQGKAVPSAHLNYAFNGAFSIFTHHFSHTPKDQRTLYLGIIVYNPGNRPIMVTTSAAASYLMSEAPYERKPQIEENPEGAIFSGPGSRAVDTVLRGERQSKFPLQKEIAAGGYELLMNQPIPVKGLAKPINGRSTFMRLNSTGAVYVADLAMYAPFSEAGEERPPTLREWQSLLQGSGLAGPRDKTPTRPEQKGELIYSRVAGVQKGSAWKATLSDLNKKVLNIPPTGQLVAYAISTLRSGRLGTGQSQAAPMIVRYPDTAYEAHGNYGVYYDLKIPLHNSSVQTRTVSISLATPIKQDQLLQGGLRFLKQPTFPFFRGTVRLKTMDKQGQTVTRYVHLWQRTGEQVNPLLTLTIAPKSDQTVHVEFLYPPDATPPQILRIATQNESQK